MAEEPRTTRVAIDTVGCKLNQAESQSLSRQCRQAGYRPVSPEDEFDVYILNTCTVTRVADRKCRHLLRAAHRRNPEALIVAVGCYAERACGELARLEGVVVPDNRQKPDLLPRLEEGGYLRRPLPAPGSLARTDFRTRALVKVQDGCNKFCAYCIVPLVRGAEASVPVEPVITEVRQRVRDGYREVVLTGTEIGSYNYGGVGLPGLLERILRETDVERLRLSSLQPQEISPGLVQLWENDRLCRHFHLSLQSGSDAVLSRMGRRYGVSRFQSALALIRGAVPEVAITTDVIVGFPGETEAEFGESYGFCRRMGFARIHVFPYSPRPGTKAAGMAGQIGEGIKRERSQKMLALARESTRCFRQRFLGRTMTVLWEQQKAGVWQGLTDNYIKVYAKGSEDVYNKLLPVELVELWGDGVCGNISQHH